MFLRRLTLAKRMCYCELGTNSEAASTVFSTFAQALSKIVVITGFNTDIEYNGVVYHVQTEDKGLNTPIILSLVYVGGAILASKRSPYQDLIETGFDAEALSERLHRQHKLICAAISAGRIEDLKRLSNKEDTGVRAEPSVESPTTRNKKETSAPPKASAKPASQKTANIPLSKPEPPVHENVSKHTSKNAVPKSGAGDLLLSLLEEQELHAGESVTLRILVSRGSSEHGLALADIPVTVKVLGTDFRPLITTTKSGRDGIAVVNARLPRFTSGRAAVLVRAVANGHEAELRRIIRHA